MNGINYRITNTDWNLTPPFQDDEMDYDPQ